MKFRGNIFSTHQLELIHHKIIFFLNRVISLLAKSFKNFFGWHFLVFVELWHFCPSKHQVLFYIKKESFVTLNLKGITFRKHTVSTNQQFIVRQSWSDKKNVFFISVKKKTFCRIFFSVFGGIHVRPPSTLNAVMSV